MTKILRSNLQSLCRRQKISADVQNRWDSLVIKVNHDDDVTRRQMRHILSHTPGIGFSLEITEHLFEQLEDAYQHVKASYADQLTGRTFCVRIKRAGHHSFNSLDAEIYMGRRLLEETQALSVSLKQPQVTVKAEIRNNKIQVVTQKIKGLGGFPLGSQGDVMSLISGGFDSTAASYLMARRGLKTHYCFFNLGGRAHEVGVKQLAHYLWSTFSESHRVKFVSVPFEGVVEEILKSVETNQMGVVLKRMMMRAASRVAADLKVPALVTGEAIAQVASQTITNLAVIDQASDRMVLRPLAAMDKQDIINITREIGAETLAANIPEYCGVISVNPTIFGDRSRVQKAEEAFNDDILEEALARASYQKIDQVLEQNNDESESVNIIEVPALSDIVIDIRHPMEAADNPLTLANNTVINIPFYEIEQRRHELKEQQRYLLYCQKGTMSKVHAYQLNQSLNDQFAVYHEGRSS